MADLRLRKTTNPKDSYHKDAAWRAMADLFRRMDSILAGEQVKVLVSSALQSSAPAATENSTITLYPSWLGDPRENDDLVPLFGVNYHELAHVLLTPRSDSGGKISRLYDKVRRLTNGWMAWNILEDQRIEAALVAMYPSTRPYLVTVFIRYIMNNEAKDAQKTAWLLGYGRNFLGRRIIDALESVFVGDESIKARARRTIDDYKRIDPVRNTAETFRLVEEFATLISLVQPPPLDHNHPADLYGGNDGNTEGQRQQNQQRAQNTEQPTPDDYDAQDDAQGAPDGSGQQDDKGNPEQGESGKGDSPDDTSDGDGQNSAGNGPDSDSDGSKDDSGSDDQGKGSGSGTDDSDGSDDHPNGQGDANGNHDAYTGAGQSTRDPNFKGSASTADLESVMQEALKRAAASDQVAADTAVARNRMAHAPIRVPKPPMWGAERPVLPVVTPVARRFQRELERVSADQDPGWSREHAAGRVNMKRFITRGLDPDTAFDQWDPGRQEAASIEVVVGLDYSDSMGNRAALLGPAAWVIKRSCDSMRMPCTVLAYATNTRTVYGPEDRAKSNVMPSLKAEGSTYATETLLEAHQILTSSDRTYKIMIMMTDGGWSSQTHVLKEFGFASNDDIVKDMNARGILTSMFFLGNPDVLDRTTTRGEMAVDYFWHCTQVRTVSQDLMQLPQFARKLITTVMKGR